MGWGPKGPSPGRPHRPALRLLTKAGNNLQGSISWEYMKSKGRKKSSDNSLLFFFTHQLSAKKLAISFVLFESEMQPFNLRKGNVMNMGNMGSV